MKIYLTEYYYNVLVKMKKASKYILNYKMFHQETLAETIKMNCVFVKHWAMKFYSVLFYFNAITITAHVNNEKYTSNDRGC